MESMQTLPPLPLKRRAVLAIERALYWSGAGYAYTALGQVRGATILMYHSVADAPRARFVDPAWHMTPEAFEAQLCWLARHRRVISLDTLADTLERGESPEVGSVVLTFDDGYLDNLEVAAPLLAKHELPATLYLATGYVDAGETQWVDRLYTAFRSRRRHALHLDGRAFDLSDPGARLEAYGHASGRLIEAPRDGRDALLAEVRAQLDCEELPPRLTLTWDDARALVRRYPGFRLGVHTVDHADLSRATPEAAEAQMRDAIAQIEAETGQHPTHFSFPYSRKSEPTATLPAKAGFRTATGNGTDFLVTADTDRFDLPRIDAKTDPTLLRFWTSGAYPSLPKRLIGRA